MNVKVRIENLDRTIDVPVGQDLRSALLENNIPLYPGPFKPFFNCRGKGICTFCQIEVVEGPGLSEQSALERVRISKGRRLSCQTRVYQDAVIRTLVEPALVTAPSA